MGCICCFPPRRIQPIISTAFDEKYQIQNIITSQSRFQPFTKIYQCVDKITKQKYALKLLIATNNNIEECATNEMKILQYLDSPYIITAFEMYCSRPKFGIVMELGYYDLFSLINIQKDGHLSELQSLEILLSVCRGLDYLHNRKIIHRDIKAENVVLTERGWKLIDFGLAIMAQHSDRPCGTNRYLAPEVVYVYKNKKSCYGSAVDLWSCGVMFYFMLSGQFPFSENNITRLHDTILCGTFATTDKVWCTICPQTMKIIHGLLTVNVDKRYTAKQTIFAISQINICAE